MECNAQTSFFAIKVILYSDSKNSQKCPCISTLPSNKSLHVKQEKSYNFFRIVCKTSLFHFLHNESNFQKIEMRIKNTNHSLFSSSLRCLFERITCGIPKPRAPPMIAPISINSHQRGFFFSSSSFFFCFRYDVSDRLLSRY